MKRYVALGAVLTALGAAGAAAVQGAAAGGSAAQTKDGGLSVMPAVIQHNAQPGQLASMTVAKASAMNGVFMTGAFSVSGSGDFSAAGRRRVHPCAELAIGAPSITRREPDRAAWPTCRWL